MFCLDDDRRATDQYGFGIVKAVETVEIKLCNYSVSKMKETNS